MEMVSIMATIILLATLATLVFAFAAYYITKAKRNKTKKRQLAAPVTGKPTRTYFERYLPDGKIMEIRKSVLDEGSNAGQWT